MSDKPKTLAETKEDEKTAHAAKHFLMNRGLFKALIITLCITGAAGWISSGYLNSKNGILTADLESSAQVNKDTVRRLSESIQKVTAEKKACLKKIADPSIRNKVDMVEYIVWRYPTVPKELAVVVAEYTEKITTEYNMDFVIVVGLMDVESAFNPFAKSKADARGLLQVMFKTWSKTYSIKKPSDLHDIEYGIRIGVQILKHYLEKNKGAIAPALRNYNGSKGDEFVNRVYVSIGKFTAFRNNTMNGKEEVTDDKTKKLQDSGSSGAKK
jgi:hypothetical protein